MEGNGGDSSRVSMNLPVSHWYCAATCTLSQKEVPQTDQKWFTESRTLLDKIVLVELHVFLTSGIYLVKFN